MQAARGCSGVGRIAGSCTENLRRIANRGSKGKHWTSWLALYGSAKMCQVAVEQGLARCEVCVEAGCSDVALLLLLCCCFIVALLLSLCCLCAVSLCWFSVPVLFVGFVQSEESANPVRFCVASIPVNKSILLARSEPSRASPEEGSQAVVGCWLLKCGAAGSKRGRSSVRRYTNV